MDKNILSLLQDKPIVVPRLLFNNYRKLNITEEELVIVMLIMSLGDKIEYNPDIFVKELNLDRRNVMRIINSLKEKNILDLEMVRSGRVTSEYISLSMLYDKLVNIIIDKKDDDKKIIRKFDYNLWNNKKILYYNIDGWVLKAKLKKVTFSYCFMSEDYEIFISVEED